MKTQALRRFDVQGLDRRGLRAAANVLRAAARQGQVALPTCTLIDRPPLLQVRLQGDAAVVDELVQRIMDKGGRIVQDFVDVATSNLGGALYPDPQALLRMGGAASDVSGPPKVSWSPVTIAIVDSGIMVDHPDLKPHLWELAPGIHGARCMNGKVDHDLTDEDGHGTMLAGTILATANREPLIRIMAVKFFDGATRPAAANAAAAIRFAVDHKADFIHVSWELGIPNDDVQQALTEAAAAGCLLVFAAGNEGTDADKMKATPSLYAAAYRKKSLVVMATDWHDDKAWFSSYGERSVDIAAPGVDIITTCPFLSKAAATSDRLPGRYRRYSGTSAASAYVTGAAALIKLRYPKLHAAALKKCLMNSVDPQPDLRCRSHGRLNLVKALDCAARVAAPPRYKRQPGSPARRKSSARRRRRSGS